MKRYFSIFAIFGFWATLIYWLGLRAPFVFDDYKVIVENPFMMHPQSFDLIWRYDPTRFLPGLTFAWNIYFSPKWVFSFHVVNVLLHVMCAFFVFLLVDRMTGAQGALLRTERRTLFFSPAMTAALIFLAHPLQTSAVTYICQRSTVMLAVFYLGTIYFYWRAREENEKKFYVLALFLGLLGVFTKPIIVTLPVLICLIEIFLVRRPGDKIPQKIAPVIPFFMVWPLLYFAGALYVKMWSYPLIDLTRQTNSIGRWDYLVTQFSVIIKYFQLLLIPVGQNLDYDFPIVNNFFELTTLLSFSAIALTVYVAVRLFSRRPWITFGIFWFFLTLLPESSLYPIEDVIFEHRLYLPMVGFALLLVDLIFQIRPVLWRNLTVVAVMLVLSVLTVGRNYTWMDEQRLWEDTIAKSPQKLRPRYNLASYFMRKGQLSAAEEQLRETLRIAPWDPTNYYNLGRIYEYKKDIDQAIAFYSQGAQSNRQAIAADCFWRLGNLTAMKGDKKNAEIYLRASLEINPQSEGAHCDLGNLLNTTERVKEAIAEYQAAIEINPASFNGRNGLGAAYIMSNDFPKGIAEYQELVRLYPDSKTALMNLSKVFILKREYLYAEPFLKKALKLTPQDPEIYYYLSLLYSYMDDSEEAKRYLQKAVNLLKAQGNNQEAETLEKFLKPGASLTTVAASTPTPAATPVPSLSPARARPRPRREAAVSPVPQARATPARKENLTPVPTPTPTTSPSGVHLQWNF